ncbi:vWA domain-containing protein [Bacillus altitudinis]|uniref:vWA domain-containing protein n=1 Tax=Bacillus altitudinis TaxID=293387 RepID=UPI002407584B|nr:VWA domain-containing protein [Bacillus altitudinis]MDF9414557.1 VWA domain-containing protein [Bacillus altitudinis]
MKFIKFNDSRIDSFLFMELTDLAKTLAKSDDVELEYGVQSYYEPFEKKIFISHFWDDRHQEDMMAGLKSDVFLRAVGTVYSDLTVFEDIIRYAHTLSIPDVCKQLFMLFEDIRIEERIKRDRPGTKKVFKRRRELYRRHFKTQLTINQERSILTDALFCAIYVKLTAESPLEEIPPLHERIDPMIPFIESSLERVYDAHSTSDIAIIVKELTEGFDELLEKDMLNTYFFFPELDYEKAAKEPLFHDLKRKPKLSEDIKVDREKEGDEDIHNEYMEVWHRETEAPSKSFLQFDLEHGGKSDLGKDAAREGDDGDQALGTVQGSAKQTHRKDYSKLEALEEAEGEESGADAHENGKENKYAFPVMISPEPPSLEQIDVYKQHAKAIEPYQKRLKQMIQKTLEHKKTWPKTDLHAGRLSKKLIRYFTESNPRLFYKKQAPSSQIDAVFTLLVDCSASMFDKMDETKKGIVLFHEALKSVQVPHQIVGFWEDTNDATETSQPNYFNTVVSFKDSLFDAGPSIMSLEPEEDNRDGYAIRQMTKMILKRREEQKFLIVFSDGEPAAFSYEQNGIVDTHEAVLEARKKGIEVINVFLSNSPIEEAQMKTIQDMYGKFSIFVPDVDTLPDVLYPLLKKLLHKSIGA